MSARLRRLTADYERIQRDFLGHKHITISPMGNSSPPEQYSITYKVRGYALDARTQQPIISNMHKVEIYLHADYPRVKPKCQILTPIFHPNFRGQVCLGDHWGAGETLSDIIVQIGDMIQYRSYNPKSPLDARAAGWAINSRHMLPAGNIDLWQPEPDISVGESEDDFDFELSSVKKENRDDFEIDISVPHNKQ